MSLTKRSVIALSLLVIAIAASCAYHNSLKVPFLLDDRPHITENPRIEKFWLLGRVLGGTDRPLVALSLSLNFALSKLDPGSYHLFNLLIHILAGFVLMGVVRLTLFSDILVRRYGQSALSLSLAVALLWVVHPLQTQSVTYIIQRAESLMGLFYLLVLYCLIRGSKSPGFKAWYLACVVFCALGMATKAVMVTAPLAALAYDRIFLAGSFKKIFKKRGWLYLGLFFTWVLLIMLITNRAGDESVGFSARNITSFQYARTQLGVILHYLRLSFWPKALVLDYGWPVAETAKAVLLPGTVIVLLIAATIRSLKASPALGFLGAWFFITLLPSSSFIPIVDIAFEHRMYLALAAPITAAVIFIDKASLKFFSKPRASLVRNIIIGALGVVLILLTVVRNRDYRDEISIWQDVVKKRPQNARGYFNLGLSLYYEGKRHLAMDNFDKGFSIEPGYAKAHYNLGSLLIKEDDFIQAAEYLKKAIDLEPDYAQAHYNLGFALVRQGRIEEGIIEYKKAVKFKPDYSQAYNNLGSAFIKQSKQAQAKPYLLKALKLDPYYAEAHYNLGLVSFELGEYKKCVDHLNQAVKLDPENAEWNYALGLGLARLERFKEAVKYFSQALRINPQYEAARTMLNIFDKP